MADRLVATFISLLVISFLALGLLVDLTQEQCSALDAIVVSHRILGMCP